MRRDGRGDAFAGSAAGIVTAWVGALSGSNGGRAFDSAEAGAVVLSEAPEAVAA